MLYYNKYHLAHKSTEIKELVKSTTCRRKLLLSYFDCEAKNTVKHKCCDNCILTCQCGHADCAIQLPVQVKASNVSSIVQETLPLKLRTVSSEQKEVLREALLEYRDHLVTGQSLLTSVDLTTGISDTLIKEIVNNSDRIFTQSDMQEKFPSLYAIHYLHIVQLFAELFQDIF